MLKFRIDYTPSPLKRPRLTRIGGRSVIYDASKKEKKDWLELAKIFRPDKPFSGPLRIFLEFYLNPEAAVINLSAETQFTMSMEVDGAVIFDDSVGAFIPDLAISPIG